MKRKFEEVEIPDKFKAIELLLQSINEQIEKMFSLLYINV